MDIQRIRVKLYAGAPADLDVMPLLDIFARWRTETGHPAGWIDLADYAHVPDGPLALLVGRQGNLGYDREDGRAGLVWRNKAGLEGAIQKRIVEAVVRGLGMFAALAAEETFPAEIALQTDRLSIDVVDRVLAPHSDETESAVAPAVHAVLDALYGRGGWRAERVADPGRPLGWEVEASSSPPLAELVKRLAAPAEGPAETEAEPPEPRRVSATEAARLMDEGYVYLDVRSLGEYANGHPAGAYNVPILIEAPGGYGLAPNPSFVEVARANFQPETPIVIGCRTVNRSERATQILLASGFRNIAINAGGFEGSMGPTGVEPGWARVGLPVSRAPEAGRSWEELKGKAGR